ncbi:hypothetical protein [uncultured Chryseobacterium sp.]|uniref:hypothetical protein n=1 Tax=uncultured Chryseobacterium sp. TaxID=259322 RepID=UPI0025F532FF|nr:hypothetical protein [uncultured Chryseobacterium sp.]
MVQIIQKSGIHIYGAPTASPNGAAYNSIGCNPMVQTVQTSAIRINRAPTTSPNGTIYNSIG